MKKDTPLIIRNFTCLFLLLLSFSTNAQSTVSTADTSETASSKDLRLFALPLVFFNPETNLGFGAAGVAAFNWKKSLATDRPSQLQLGFAYTLNKQVLFYIPYQIFTPGEQFSLSGELGYYKYFYYYYGIGSETLKESEETYDVNFPRLRFRGLYQAFQGQFVGLQYSFDYYENMNFKPDGLLDNQKPIGIEDGINSGIGPIYIFDTRNNVFAPDEGSYVELNSLFYAPWLGSDFNFQKVVIDARKYISKKPTSVLALQFYGEFTSGDAPFYQLALLGGNKRLRGYIEGRFRDNHYMMLQAEFRQHLFWRIGMVGFAGFGGVAETISDFGFNSSVWTVGVGLRVLLLKEDRINVRFDAGFGKKTSGYYLTVTEAF